MITCKGCGQTIKDMSFHYIENGQKCPEFEKWARADLATSKLISHLCGLNSGTACDAILVYLSQQIVLP